MARMMARVAEKKEGERADVIDEQDIENIQAMSEIYADIFCFAPHFLGEAIYKGDPAERFKLAVNFAFSILHAM